MPFDPITVLAVSLAILVLGLFALLGWCIASILLAFREVVSRLTETFKDGPGVAQQPPPPVAPPPPPPPLPPQSHEASPAPSPAAPAKPTPLPAAPATPAHEAFPGAPSWFNWAAHEIGTKDQAGHTGPAIERYIQLAHAGETGDPWCAIFANAALESVGVKGTKSASSQSFRTNPNFKQLSGPALGAIAVFWRNSKTSGLGHVGFYRGELDGEVWVLGGNEGSMVQIEALPKDSSSFGLIGYWWPASVPLPQTGAVTMPQGSPTHVQTAPNPSETAVSIPRDGLDEKGITATVFGGTADPNTSAYDGHVIDDHEIGVALPFHFSGPRSRVQVTNPKTGQTVTASIVDVGPWFPNEGKGWPSDPYWQTGTRPRAETDNNTNHAGIDLTPGAAALLGIDGKGEVNWQFVS